MVVKLLSSRPATLRLSSCATTLLTVCLIFFLYSRISQISTAPTPADLRVENAIPKKIWYKLGPNGLSEDSRKWIDTCLEKNPTYEADFMTDESGDTYVKEHFAFRPDIVETYLALPVPILKADFLRYLLLYAEGGIWSDLDVSCEDTPIGNWIPEQYKQNASLIVGWEFDWGWGDTFVRQFASWMIMAKPRSPHILMIIDDIMEGVREHTRKDNVTAADLTLEVVGEVVDFTGPRRMTRGIVKSLQLNVDRMINVDNFSEILEPKLVGDVLVLPGYSFALSSNHYGKENIGPSLVKHHYAGSWKNDHGGEIT